MNLNNKKIGIWGYGIGGRSILNFLLSQAIVPAIMDRKELTKEDRQFFEKNTISYYVQDDYLEEFFINHDLIIPSAGIDLRPYAHYSNKFITEVDLFYSFFKKPIIAVTGTIGKTSITHLLSQLLKSQNIVTGGNIGTGTFDLLGQTESQGALLELSSFQLEHCQSFAPDLAIWTNVYPNHLDRHGTMQQYFEAKYTILKKQQKNQQALVPYELASLLLKKYNNNNNKGALHFFSSEPITNFTIFESTTKLFWIENDTMYQWHQGVKRSLVSLDQLPSATFAINGLIITAALSLLNLDPSLIKPLYTETIPDHRMEKCGFINSISFYNDSKATIMESTIAALKKLSNNPIILILGGLSKGVDRSLYFKKLPPTLKHIICFGAEAQYLCQKAHEQTLISSALPTLDQAFDYALCLAQPHDHIVLSPGGSSYDLYRDYQERGDHFKQLVSSYIQSNKR